MYTNHISQDINDALPSLCREVMNSAEFGSRAGLTKDVTHVGVTLLQPWKREILLTNRKHNLAAQIAETMWVLSGRDDVEWLERYLPRARDFSDDGLVWRGAYGKRIRRWPRRGDDADVVDQLAHVIRLLKEDPNSRRAVISIYDPDVDCSNGKDIPCNDFLTFSIRNDALDVEITIRSNDLMWGWSGINAFEWSTLQEIVAGVLGARVGALHFSISSLHLYEQHWERATAIVESSTIFPLDLYSIPFTPRPHDQSIDGLDVLFQYWFKLEEDIRLGRPSDALVNAFPEQMLRSWLYVIQWWWSGDAKYLEPLRGSRLAYSAVVAMQPKPKPAEKKSDFVEYVTSLHNEKDSAYGDSWKKRGEMFAIMANIARKIDRLGANTAGESAADTAIDLLVYLAKYRFWLTENADAPFPLGIIERFSAEAGSHERANQVIRVLDKHLSSAMVSVLAEEDYLTREFSVLERMVLAGDPVRYRSVDVMLPHAFMLARTLWEKQK